MCTVSSPNINFFVLDYIKSAPSVILAVIRLFKIVSKDYFFMQYKRLILLKWREKKAAALLPVDVAFEPLFTRQQVFINIPNNTCAFPVVSKISAMTQTVDDNTAGVLPLTAGYI